MMPEPDLRALVRRYVYAWQAAEEGGLDAICERDAAFHELVTVVVHTCPFCDPGTCPFEGRASGEEQLGLAIELNDEGRYL
jgi:hypothetical protein